MDTRDQIIQCAIHHIQRSGYSNFSYADLADQVKIRKASIHHYFARKEDLALAVIGALKTELLKNSQRLEHAFPLARDQFYHLLKGVWDFTKENQTLCPIATLCQEMAVLPESCVRALQDLCECEFEIVEKILTLGSLQSSLQPHMARECFKTHSLWVISHLKGALVYQRLSRKQILPKLIPHLVRSYFVSKSVDLEKSMETLDNGL
jgi:TetR/AcrR family transcriptional repressor of nem operon